MSSDEEIARLEERCGELERQVTRLRQDNDRLQQLNVSINKERIEYLQNVSHQLVAPLHAIKWHIENLTHGRIQGVDRAKKVFRSIYSQATIAVHLAKNFVFMSNLEADHSLIDSCINNATMMGVVRLEDIHHAASGIGEGARGATATRPQLGRPGTVAE